jgi:hypothetical protein
MQREYGIDVTGINSFDSASQVVFDAIKDCMDDIRDDVAVVSASLTPFKTGKLENSQQVTRYFVNLEQYYFTVTFTALNKDFDYATWTHDETYNLGAGSQQKTPAHSRFATGTLHVGDGYLTQVVESSQEAWIEYISYTIDRKLKASLKQNGG